MSKRCHRRHNCKHDCKRDDCKFNACTIVPTLLILCQSGILNNDRAFILILLFWLCGGVCR